MVVKLGDDVVTGKVTWAEGENVVTVEVTDSISSEKTTYTVTVTNE